jgi:3-dehydroquinate synthase
VSDLVVASHRGPYTVTFDERPFAGLERPGGPRVHAIVDRRVAALYPAELAPVLATPSTLCLEASEASKSLDRFPAYVQHLVGAGVRRGHVLVGIGGGVIQDITAFLAATLLRGLDWEFYPTTLLAQADSCIGSKSSINVGRLKNVLGTFTPPRAIHIATAVLGTLRDVDLRSGLGEILKAHAIAGPAAFDEIAADYTRLRAERVLMIRYLRRSLVIKQAIVETDEFDRGPRRVMNYGHSFGHAIESVTGFAVPHGIAVTIGMDLANHVAVRLGLAQAAHYARMHPTLAANYAGWEPAGLSVDALLAVLGTDKKNGDGALGLVLPDAEGRVAYALHPNDARLRAACAEYLAGLGDVDMGAGVGA